MIIANRSRLALGALLTIVNRLVALVLPASSKYIEEVTPELPAVGIERKINIIGSGERDGYLDRVEMIWCEAGEVGGYSRPDRAFEE